MKVKVKLSSIFVLILTLLLGCGKGYKSSFLKPHSDLDLITCIVVLPFDSSPSRDGEKPGRIIATMLANKLLSTGKFKVLEWEEVDGILRDQNVTLPTSIDSTFAAKIGDVLSVEGVLFGAVTEYGYKKGGQSFDAIPVVGLMAELLSMKSRNVVWSSTLVKSSSDFLDTGRDPLSRVALIVVDEIVNSFSNKVKKKKLDYSTPCWNPFVTSDIDNDGILNFADSCPLEAEDFNGILDTDGCPEPEIVTSNYRQLAELRGNRIIYEGNIEYVEKEATLLPNSIPILKGVASLINEHTEIRKVTIEGFSEEIGNEKFTEEFSFNRAMAVKDFLMREGIPSEKLSAVGYEKTKNWRRSLVKEIEFSVAK